MQKEEVTEAELLNYIKENDKIKLVCCIVDI